VKVVTISSWLNFGRPVPPGRGLQMGRKIFGSAILRPTRSVYVSLSAFFILGRIRFSETETGSSLVSTVLSIKLEKLEPVS